MPEQHLCLVCASDEGGFLDADQQPLFKRKDLDAHIGEITDTGLSNKICHKCAFEVEQCNTFVDKIGNISNKKFTATACCLCSEPCVKNQQTYFKLSRLDTKDRAFVDRVHHLFNINVFSDKTSKKSPCVCLNCRYSVDLLDDLKNLANEATNKFANIQSGIDVSNVPKTVTLIANRKTTSTKSAVLDLATPSASDSDSSRSSMGSSKKSKTLRKSVAKDKCGQCKTAVTSNNDTYKIHKTGISVCKTCWCKYNPIKTNTKSKSKRKKIEYPSTRLCSILVEDVLNTLEEKGYREVKNKNGAVCYKVLNSNNEKAQSPASDISSTRRLSKSSRNKSRTPESIDESETPVRSTRSKRHTKVLTLHKLEQKDIESNSQNKRTIEANKRKKPDSPVEKKKPQNKRNSVSSEDNDEVNVDMDSDVKPSKRLKRSTNPSPVQSQKSTKNSPLTSRRSTRKRERSESFDSSVSSRKSSRIHKKQNYQESEEVIEIEDDSSDKQGDLNSDSSPNQDKNNFKRPKYNRIASSDSDNSKVSDSGRSSRKLSAKVPNSSNISKSKKLETSESEEIDVLKATDEETRDDVNDTNESETPIEIDTNKTDDDDDNAENKNDETKNENDVTENSNKNEQNSLNSFEENDKNLSTNVDKIEKNVDEKEMKDLNQENNSRHSSRQSSVASSTKSRRRLRRNVKSKSTKATIAVDSIEISDTDNDEVKSIKEELEERYACTVCDKIYENSKYGLQHELTHLKIKLQKVQVPEIKICNDSDTDEHQNKDESEKETTEISEIAETENLEQSEKKESNINSENQDECLQDANITNESNDETEQKEQDKSKFNNADNMDKDSTVETENIEHSKLIDESETEERVESDDKSNSVDHKITDSNALCKKNDIIEGENENSNSDQVEEVALNNSTNIKEIESNNSEEIIRLSKNKTVEAIHVSDSGDDEGSPICEVNSVSPVVDSDEDSGGRVIVNFDDSPQPTENENTSVVEVDDSHVTDNTAHPEVQQAHITENDELEITNSNNTDIEMISHENEVETTSNNLASEEATVISNDENCKEVHENGNESRQDDENNDNNAEDEALTQESLEELMRRKELQVVDEVEEESEREQNSNSDHLKEINKSPKKQIDIEVDTKVIQQNVDVMEEEVVNDGFQNEEVQEVENNVQNFDYPTL